MLTTLLVACVVLCEATAPNVSPCPAGEESQGRMLSLSLKSAEQRVRNRGLTKPDLWRRYRTAKKALRTGHTEEAERLLAGLVSEATSFAPAYYYLGLSSATREQEIQAMRCYERALELDPEFILVRNNLGNIHYRNARFEKAAEQYMRVVEIEPCLAAPHRHLALCYSEDRKRFAEAVFHYQRFIELDPVSPYRRKVEHDLIQLRAALAFERAKDSE